MNLPGSVMDWTNHQDPRSHQVTVGPLGFAESGVGFITHRPRCQGDLRIPLMPRWFHLKPLYVVCVLLGGYIAH